MTLTWVVDTSPHAFLSTQVHQYKNAVKKAVVSKTASGSPRIEDAFLSRSSDINLTTTTSGSVTTITFSLSNLVKSTDEAEYDVTVVNNEGNPADVTRKTSLIINSKLKHFLILCMIKTQPFSGFQ